VFGVSIGKVISVDWIVTAIGEMPKRQTLLFYCGNSCLA
jgi:hypothetical protein